MVARDIRIVVASTRSFHDVGRLKMALDKLLEDIYVSNQYLDESEHITEDDVAILINGDKSTIAGDINEIVDGTRLAVDTMPVDWDKGGKKAFFENCVSMGMRATHGLVFTERGDEGMETLIKSCLQSGARIRIYSTRV